jgi:hypothetical protein
MAHDLLKFGLALAFMAMVVIAMALLVSVYLSTYKPGVKGTQTPASAISGGKSGRAAAPSPTAGINATMRAIPQYARYAPPGPLIPEPVQPARVPPMPMEVGARPPAGWPCPPPSAAPSKPPYGGPAMPSAPGINSIIQILFRLLPLIFSHRFDLAPIWPRLEG